jgi:hypothetical protein
LKNSVSDFLIILPFYNIIKNEGSRKIEKTEAQQEQAKGKSENILMKIIAPQR